MAAFVIADIDIQDPEGYQEYLKQVPALVAKHGGVYRARGGPHSVLEGEWNPKRLVLLEFPDRSAAEAFNEDPEYLEIKKIRLKTTHTDLVILEGL
jgi:uncharacterized protein (DUF1330 family)